MAYILNKVLCRTACLRHVAISSKGSPQRKKKERKASFICFRRSKSSIASKIFTNKKNRYTNVESFCTLLNQIMTDIMAFTWFLSTMSAHLDRVGPFFVLFCTHEVLNNTAIFFFQLARQTMRIAFALQTACCASTMEPGFRNTLPPGWPIHYQEFRDAIVRT